MKRLILFLSSLVGMAIVGRILIEFPVPNLIYWGIALAAADQIYSRFEYKNSAEEFSLWMTVSCLSILYLPYWEAILATFIGVTISEGVLLAKRLPLNKRLFNIAATTSATALGFGGYTALEAVSGSSWPSITAIFGLIISATIYELVIFGLLCRVMPSSHVKAIMRMSWSLPFFSVIAALSIAVMVEINAGVIALIIPAIVIFLKPSYIMPRLLVINP